MHIFIPSIHYMNIKANCRGQELKRILAAEPIQGPSLPLESVHYVHGGDGLPLSVLRVGDGVPDHVLQENLEDAPGLLIDQAGDPLNTAPSGETPDGRLSDPLDIVTKNLPVPLGSSLPESLTTFATSRHLDQKRKVWLQKRRPKVGAKRHLP